MQLVFDSEVFANYYLASFLDISTGAVRSFDMVGDEGDFRIDDLREFIAGAEIITFNGNHFDVPLLAMALAGKTCSQIKTAADLIIVSKWKSWDVTRHFQVTVPKLDHIDLIEVAPGFSSLKIYAGRMHTQSIQDLPYAPDKLIADGEYKLLREYCENDLRNTQALFERLYQQIDLRRTMSKQYGIDLRSKSDAQIAEAVITLGVETHLQRKIDRPAVPPGSSFRYVPPDWIRFNRKDLLDLLADIRNATFIVSESGALALPKVLSDRAVTIGTTVYRIGIGGIHSSEKCAAHLSDENTLLIDRDVASYYPSIVLLCGLAPAQMGGAFLKVYRGIVEGRLLAKNKANELKSRISFLESEIENVKQEMGAS